MQDLRKRDYIKTIKSEHSTHHLRSDGIVEIHLKNDHFLTLEDSKEIVANTIKITNGVSHKVLVIAGHLTLSDAASRKYASEKTSTDHMIALALVTSSLPQKIIANFVMKFQEPWKPTRVFNSTYTAENWLQSL